MMEAQAEAKFLISFSIRQAKVEYDPSEGSLPESLGSQMA